MNIRTELPQLSALQQSASIEVSENLALYDDKCYNHDFLEQQYGDLVRNLIADCIERGQLERKQLQDGLRDLFDRTSLSSQDCVIIAVEILRERFDEAANLHFNAALPGIDVAAVSGATNSSASVVLPDVAPELYENRKRPESPVEYYDRVWRKFADAGVLYQDQLRKLDPKLIPAVHVFCSKRGLDAKEHLPPPRHERTKRLAVAGDVAALVNLHNAERLRNWRHKQDASPS